MAAPALSPAEAAKVAEFDNAPDPYGITESGAYDLPEHEYLSDPVEGGSLSFSGAKTLLPPGCPALFRHRQSNGRPPKPAFDFGHAVHSMVLGVGEPIVVIDADDWRGKAAREARDAAYAAGHVPLLAADHATAKAAADAVRAHPRAGALFAEGIAEQSLFWRDPLYGVWRRCRIDWRTTLPSGRPVVVDLKTCVSAEPSAIGKAVANYHYYQQHPYYLDGVKALGLAEDPAFLFVFVEKEAPHLVTVCELDEAAVEAGQRRNQAALALYAECVETDIWPSYTDDVTVVQLPRWAA
jgi:hypothetical protein